MADEAQEAGSAKVLYRVQFGFTQEAHDEFQEIMELAGNPTKADVVRNALAIYRFLLNAQRDGKTPAVFSGEGDDFKLETFPLKL